MVLPPASKRQRLNGVSVDQVDSSVSLLVDSSDFDVLRKNMENFDAQREVVIKRSRDIQKLAKQAIFAAHRNDLGKSSKQITDAEQVAHELLPVIQQTPDLRHGSFANAMEEYAEAKIFQAFLNHGHVIPSTELPLVDRDEYLGGVLDFTGELNRYAIAKATIRDINEVKRCRDIAEALMGEFLQFDLRNGSIRKKYDSLKYTLKKLENTLYELSLAEAGFKPQVEKDEAPQPQMESTADEIAE
ncbi:g6602 [Coccomyxa elongata]